MWAKDFKFGKIGSGRRLRRAEHRETLGDGRLLLPVTNVAVRFGPKDKEQVSVCTEIKLPAASSFLQTELCPDGAEVYALRNGPGLLMEVP